MLDFMIQNHFKKKNYMFMKRALFFSFVAFLLMLSCSSAKKETESQSVQTTPHKEPIRPPFSSDSAFFFIKQQCEFGPRVPNTPAHDNCAEYLVNKLKSFGLSVSIQKFTATAYNQTVLNGVNIIGRLHPEMDNRIVLFSHWDSRHVCDNDSQENINKPVMGANDGASGVGVLLEVARQLQKEKDSIGVDIVFLDLEDYGQPSFETEEKKDTWCLGAQYLARNPYYDRRPQKGILLDMVGAASPYFGFDQISLNFAEPLLQEVWSTAHALDYNSSFVPNVSGAVLDDHYYINSIAGIPTIDIIDYNQNRGFPSTWHTVNDTPEHIDKKTLQMVGEVLISVLRKK